MEFDLRNSIPNEIIKYIPIGIMALNKNGEIEYINNYALTMLGYKINDLLGKNVGILYSDPKEAYRIGTELNRTPHGQSAKIETYVRAKIRKGEDLGEEIPIQLSAMWLYDENKNRIGSIGYFDRSLSATQKVTQLVTELMTNGDYTTTLSSVVEGTQNAVRCDAVVLYSYNQDTDTFTYPPKMIGVHHQNRVYVRESIPTKSIVYTMLGKDEPYIVRNISKDQLFKNTRFAKDEKIISLIAIPLITQNRRVGVMFVNYRSLHRFTDIDISNVKHFANQASVAISNAQLYRKTKRQADVFKTLYEAGNLSAGRISLDETLVRLAKQAVILLKPHIYTENAKNFCFAHLALVESGEYKSVAASSNQIYERLRTKSYSVNISERDNRSIGIAGRAVITGKTQNVGNVRGDNDYIEIYSEVNSQLSVPLKSDDQVIGVLTIEDTNFNSFSSEDVADFELLASHAAPVIRTAQLLNQLRNAQENAQMVAQVTTLGNRQKTLRSIVDGTRSVTDCDVVVLFIYDSERDRIEQPPTLSSKGQVDERVLVENIREGGIVYKMLEQDELYVVEDIEKNELFRGRSFSTGQKIKSVIAIPFVVQNQKVGVMFVNYQSLHHFSSTEITNLKLFANQAAVAILNARLFDQVTRNAELLRSIYHSRWSISEKLDLKETLIEITQQASRVIDVDATSGCFSHVELLRDGILKTVAASTNEVMKKLENDNIQANLYGQTEKNIGIAGRAVISGETRVVGNVKEDKDYIETYPEINSQLSVPLKSGERIIGSLTVEHPDINAFSSEDVAKLELWAVQASSAISTARLLEQIRGVQGTAQIVAKLTTLGKRQETLRSIVQGIKSATECDVVMLFVYDSDHKKLEHPPIDSGIIHHREKTTLSGQVEISSIVYHMLERNDLLVIEDVEKHELVGKTRFAIDEKIKSEVVIPLIAQGQKVGVMFVNYRTFHKFSPTEITNLELFANQAAIAIYNQQLYDKAREDNIALKLSEQRSEGLTLLYELGTKINENTQDLKETLKRIVAGANSLTGTNTGIIYLIDAHKNITAEASYPEDYQDKHPKPRMNDQNGLTRSVIRTGKSLYIYDLEKDERVNPLLYRKYGYCSMAAIPLILNANVIGVLFIHAEHLHDFKEDIPLLEALASQASLSAHMALLLEQKEHELNEQNQLRKDLEDLQLDLGRTLHTYFNTLITIQSTLRPAIIALGPDPFTPGKLPPTEEIEVVISHARKNFSSSLKKLIEERKSNVRKGALSANDWEKLNGILKKLSEHNLSTISNLEFQIPLLRLSAREVIDICRNIQPGFISKEVVREAIRNSETLERFSCLVSLRHAQDATIAMDYEVRYLRERIITGEDKFTPPSIYSLSELVKEAAHNFSELANYMNVQLDIKTAADNPRVRVVRRDVVRALGNLIHNAIKYSWNKSDGEPSWVKIRVYRKDKFSCVNIEDYGVAIAPDELDLIFQSGYRGRWSSGRGRQGTGIGLRDVLETVLSYGGKVTVSSVPAIDPQGRELKHVPHITTAEMLLPTI